MRLRTAAIRLAYAHPEGSPLRTALLSCVAMEFPTEDALKKYLDDHPKADRSKHSVKDSGGGKGKKDDEGATKDLDAKIEKTKEVKEKALKRYSTAEDAYRNLSKEVGIETVVAFSSDAKEFKKVGDQYECKARASGALREWAHTQLDAGSVTENIDDDNEREEREREVEAEIDGWTHRFEAKHGKSPEAWAKARGIEVTYRAIEDLTEGFERSVPIRFKANAPLIKAYLELEEARQASGQASVEHYDALVAKDKAKAKAEAEKAEAPKPKAEDKPKDKPKGEVVNPFGSRGRSSKLFDMDNEELKKKLKTFTQKDLNDEGGVYTRITMDTRGKYSEATKARADEIRILMIKEKWGDHRKGEDRS